MMINPRPFFIGLVVAMGALLGACSTTGKTGGYHEDPARKELLQTLRQCLVDIPISGSRGKDFISPCVGQDVSSLNGIYRSHLQDVLGPPRLCLTESETNFPDKDRCPGNQSPVWSFYRHADAIDIGGGPELVCVTHEGRDASHCATVEWRRTK